MILTRAQTRYICSYFGPSDHTSYIIFALLYSWLTTKKPGHDPFRALTHNLSTSGGDVRSQYLYVTKENIEVVFVCY